LWSNEITALSPSRWQGRFVLGYRLGYKRNYRSAGLHMQAIEAEELCRSVHVIARTNGGDVAGVFPWIEKD